MIKVIIYFLHIVDGLIEYAIMVLMKCIHCNKRNVVKNGHQKGVQRYKCKSCKRVFRETSNKEKYNRATKTVVQLLYSLLENDFYKERDINEAIKKVAKNKINNPKIRIYENYKKNGLPNDKINCEKESRPKVLICQSDKYIDFFLLPDFIPTDNKKTRIIKIKEKAL